MTDKPPSIADLIAKTPGAQTREQAIESLKARRARMLQQSEPPKEPEPEFGDPEWSKRFHERHSKARLAKTVAKKADEVANDNEV